MTDDRFDVTPAQCCDTCRHLVSNDHEEAEACLRDNDELATYWYRWVVPDELMDTSRKSCPQWQAKENDDG